MTDTERKALVERLRKRREVEIIGGYERIEWEDEDALEAADRIEQLEAENARLREALEEFVASTGVSDDPDALLVDALVYENAMRVLGLQK